MNLYQNLLIDELNGILTVTINRPEALNALNQQTMSDLSNFFKNALPNVNQIKGIILTGAGAKSFVAGADISEFTQLDAQAALEMAQTGQDIFFQIERFPRPVIAAVNGFALGGGCELAMACHLRIAGEKAKFGQPEVNLGIIPGYGGTQRLSQLVGKAKALELMMTADMIGAEEAHRLGLANHVVAAGQEVAKATEILEKIASKAPLAISKVIECVNAYYEDGKNGYETEISEFASCVNTNDFKEGATAFLEKRKPVFKSV
jgi:enoyl-CoA hydratase